MMRPEHKSEHGPEFGIDGSSKARLGMRMRAVDLGAAAAAEIEAQSWRRCGG
jgi:hypothetical protein